MSVTITESIYFRPETLQEINLIKTAGAKNGLKMSTSFIVRVAVKLFADTLIDMEASNRNWIKRIESIPGTHRRSGHTLETRMKMRESQKKRFEKERTEREKIIKFMNKEDE